MRGGRHDGLAVRIRGRACGGGRGDGDERDKQRPGALAYARLVACFGLSFGLLSLGLKSGMSISIAYAVWVGIGTVGAVVVGILRYGESARPLRLFFVSLVLAAVVGLKLVG